MSDRRRRAGDPPPAGLPPHPTYASSAWAVLRSHATASAVAAATFGGMAAGLTGAVPATSNDPGTPTPPVVTADCPPSGVLPDGQACVIGPPTGDPAPAAPAPEPAPAAPETPAPAAAPAEPPPAGEPAAPVQEEPTPSRKAPAADAEDKHEEPASSPTRVGPKRTERAEQAPRERPRKRRALPDSGPPASNGAAGLPALTFNAPSPARAVPNVLLDRFPIPPFLLPIYQAAAVEYDVPWQILAAINEIETDYGRNLNVSSAGAQGWMQFMPASWKAYGVDANGDGRKDPYNPADAIFAAARYLKAAGAKDDLRRAIFAYNHANWYVESVMLRAKLVRALPGDLVDALTGLTQGRFPVAGRARYPKKGGSEKGILIDVREDAPVIAVNDGVVKRYGRSKRLGLHLVLEDAHGNRYTYAHLRSVARSFPAPRGRRPGEALPEHDHDHGEHAEHADPKPRIPASAGRPTAPKTQTRTVRVVKERLFANPARPASLPNGGERQLGDMSEELPAGATVSDYFTADFPLKRSDIVLKPMRPGAQVIGGTVLGRAGRRAIRFRVRPAGKGAPAIDPRPVLDGWRLLEATEIHKGKALRGFDARNASIGRLMLMSKESLARRVLADKRIRVYECGRRDIATGAIDRRVLITLAYLASSGLHPLVSALQCGHSYYTAGGSVSWHSSGNAVDIASINGTAILGHQGKDSVTDVTIRRMLNLQGWMRPGQIISLMTYDGHPNTMSMSDHADHIHVGFQPRNAGSTTAAGPDAAVLRPGQWKRLVRRLGEIDNPEVRR
jgi:soluble lytic murein transglycosylase-like protein